jgi:hypothetical protein
MKINLKSVTFLLFMIFIIPSCSDQRGDGDGDMNEDKTFKTPEEAVQKAKSDLIEVLETNKDISLGIDVARLRNADAGKLIRYAEADFERILNTDSLKSLSEIAASDRSMLSPYVNDNEVVAIAEIKEVTNGWKIAGLGNEALTDDLNRIGIASGMEKTAVIYEIPNLHILIFAVRDTAGESYYLNYERFNLQQSVSISDFYPVIKREAMRFNKEFGDQLKKEKLVR